MDTTRPYSETKREKAGACTPTKTEESGRRDELKNCSGQDRNQKTEAIVGDTGLKCWYTNACSLINKTSELRERVQNVYDIIGISETRTGDFVNDTKMSIDGYNM